MSRNASFQMAMRFCIVGALLIVPCTAYAAGEERGPVDGATGPQLFIDDHLIAELNGVKKVTQHPTRSLPGPVIGWKERNTQPYVAVLRDPESGLFRMWYNYDTGVDAAIAYAESKDGVAWTLPTLNILGPDNRVLSISRSNDHGSFGVSIVDDGPTARDRSRRYKLMWWSGITEPAGAAIAFSPDGLRWTPYERNPVLPHYPLGHPKARSGVGDIVDLLHDPLRARYVAIVKLHALESDGWAAGPRAGKAYRRLVGASTSDDAMNWTEPRRIITPEPRDDGLLEFYGAGGTIARGPLLISFVRMLHDDYAPEPGGEPTGIGYTTLATSRDGQHWQRHDDIFFDRNPQSGTWDRAMSWIGSTIILGNELYLYYGGYARGHKVEPRKERQIGLVKIPVDRFVSIEPHAGRSGTLRTVALRLPSSLSKATLRINADASDGRIRVQARTVEGTIIPGLAFADCNPIETDGLRLPAEWAGGQRIPTGQAVQFEFELTAAKLFAFELGTSSDTSK